MPDIEEKDDVCDYCDDCDGTIKITSCDDVENKSMDEVHVGSTSKFQKPNHYMRRWTEEEQQALPNEFGKKTLHKTVCQVEMNCKS